MESVTFAQIGLFVACLVVILGVAVAIKVLINRDPALHREYATKAEHAALKAEVDKIDQERRVSVANLHAKIDANTAITSATGAKVDQMNIQLQQLNTHLLTTAKK